MAKTKEATRAQADLALGKRTVRDRTSALACLHHQSKGLQVGLEHMGIHQGPVTDEQIRMADDIRWKMIEQLSHCETFIADQDVCHLLNTAGTAYPAAHMFLTDILAPTGMVYFQDPIDDPDDRPYEVDVDYPLRAMTWSLMALRDPAVDPVHSRGQGIYGSAIEKAANDRADWEREVIRAQGRFAIVITAYTDTKNIPNPDRVPASKMPTIYPIASVLWEVDAADGGQFWGSDEEQAQLGRAPYVKILMAYWAIMRQKLTQATLTVIKPHPRDITYSKGRTVNFNPDVHVVRMKPNKTRHKYIEHGGANYNRPNWAVQWWVRAHWRRQIDKNTGETKPALLINSYLKGPPDKPMIGSERVYLPPSPKDDGTEGDHPGA